MPLCQSLCEAHKPAAVVGKKKRQKRLACHICPQFEHASRGLWHGFHSPAHDAHFSDTLVDTEHLIHSWLPYVSDVPLSSGAEGSQGTLFCREGR